MSDKQADAYCAATEDAALFDRPDCGLIVITGTDRATWLHNLVTNDVRSLKTGGRYTFVVDMKGRIQFDANMLALDDTLWLDIDRNYVTDAIQHLDRYLISEDVQMTDRSNEFARLACFGPRASQIARTLGAESFDSMAPLEHVDLGESTRLVKHTLAPHSGFEIFIPADQAETWRTRLTQEHNATPAGVETLETLRIEAGIPRLGRDIDQTTLPAETGQTPRGVSYDKGCYLGQEIIERMRSAGSLARRLVRISLPDGSTIQPPTPLTKSGKEVGRITSLVKHPQNKTWIGLAYLRTKLTSTEDITAGSPPATIAILEESMSQ